jgi:hypothetical protein
MLQDFHKLIERHIARAGYRVNDVTYHTELFAVSSVGTIRWPGANKGLLPGNTYFFGNVSVWSEFYTLTLLAAKNCLRLNFYTQLMNDPAAYTNFDIIQGVNLDMSLMGNGDYTGLRRLNNVSFSHFNESLLGFDPGATWMSMITLNGFLYLLI